MSTENKTQNNTKNNPTHEVFAVKSDKQKDRSFWYKIGVGWKSDKGNITTSVGAFPSSGFEMVLVPIKEKEKTPQ